MEILDIVKTAVRAIDSKHCLLYTSDAADE